MERNAYRVEYHKTSIPKNEKFFEWLEEMFTNDEGTITVEGECLQEIIDTDPVGIRAAHKEELEALEKMLKESESDCVELKFA